MRTLIIAPHPDDEIIGCLKVLAQHAASGAGSLALCVYYADYKAGDLGPERAAKEFKFKIVREIYDTGSAIYACGPPDRIFAPDPYFETHPQHRYWGKFAEDILRSGRAAEVIFYSTNMRAPYIFEVLDSKAKRLALDTCYPEKSDLWRYDHRYFLFEGYCQWAYPRVV